MLLSLLLAPRQRRSSHAPLTQIRPPLSTLWRSEVRIYIQPTEGIGQLAWPNGYPRIQGRYGRLSDQNRQPEQSTTHVPKFGRTPDPRPDRA